MARSLFRHWDIIQLGWLVLESYRVSKKNTIVRPGRDGYSKINPYGKEGTETGRPLRISGG